MPAMLAMTAKMVFPQTVVSVVGFVMVGFGFTVTNKVSRQPLIVTKKTESILATRPIFTKVIRLLVVDAIPTGVEIAPDL